jgi:hypothetical protein
MGGFLNIGGGTEANFNKNVNEFSNRNGLILRSMFCLGLIVVDE